MGLFLADELYPGADGPTRRSLGSVKTDSSWVRKVVEASGVLKLKSECPTWKRDAWAHVGFPALKTAIYITDKQGGEELRERWKRYGWRLLIVSQYRLTGMSVRAIADELNEAIRSLRTESK